MCVLPSKFNLVDLAGRCVTLSDRMMTNMRWLVLCHSRNAHVKWKQRRDELLQPSQDSYKLRSIPLSVGFRHILSCKVPNGR